MNHLDNIVGGKMRKYNTMFHKNEIRREFSGRIRVTALIPVTQNVQLIIGYVWGNRRIITGRLYHFVLCDYTHIVTFVLVRLYAVFRSSKLLQIFQFWYIDIVRRRGALYILKSYCKQSILLLLRKDILYW